MMLAAVQAAPPAGRRPGCRRLLPPAQRPPAKTCACAPRDDTAPMLLRVLPLFAGVPEATLAFLASNAISFVLHRDQRLKAGGSLFLVVSGALKFALGGVRRKERVLYLIGPGEAHGELGLFAPRPAGAYAQALTETKLLRIPGCCLRCALEAEPEVARRLMRSLASGIQRATHMLVAISHRSAATRIASFLLGLEPDPDVPGDACVRLPVQKKLIAAMLGLSSEAFSRTLRRLERAGAIQVRGPSVRILDRQAICAAAGY